MLFCDAFTTWWLRRLNVSISRAMYFRVHASMQSNQSTRRHDHNIVPFRFFFLLRYCCLSWNIKLAFASTHVMYIDSLINNHLRTTVTECGCMYWPMLLCNLYFSQFFSPPQTHYLSQSHANCDPKNACCYPDLSIDYMSYCVTMVSRCVESGMFHKINSTIKSSLFKLQFIV